MILKNKRKKLKSKTPWNEDEFFIPKGSILKCIQIYDEDEYNIFPIVGELYTTTWDETYNDQWNWILVTGKKNTTFDITEHEQIKFRLIDFEIVRLA